MSRTPRFAICVLAATLSIPATPLVAQLQSVDEALKLSRATGRPIFAMAGNKT